MRVLLDSNVWLSVLSRRGFCRRLWRRVKREFVAVSGDWIVGEVEEKMQSKFRAKPRAAAKYARHVRDVTSHVALTSAPPKVCRDPDDDVVLALAVEAKCEFLITGDGDLLALDGHAGIRIVTPRAFADLQGWQMD